MTNVGPENNLKCAESSIYLNTSMKLGKNKTKPKQQQQKQCQKDDEVKASCYKEMRWATLQNGLKDTWEKKD